MSLRLRGVAIAVLPAAASSGLPEGVLRGRIDEVMIFDRPLSAGEVNAIYKAAP